MSCVQELNENNNAIRFLGFDSILQPALMFKLFIVMLVFGMNAPGRLKWAFLLMLVTYYFYHVRCLYLDHFEQQKRLLNLNQPQVEQQVPQQERNGQAGGARAASFILVAIRLVYIFFVSLHHDWIDPIMRQNRAQRAMRQAIENEARR
jgi:hypothetical protein